MVHCAKEVYIKMSKMKTSFYTFIVVHNEKDIAKKGNEQAVLQKGI